MFVQVIQGKVSDAAALRSALDRWQTDLAPGADGYLGSTGGVTDDGRFIALARFDSEESARRNSDRPEQGAWWAETEKLLDGPATFHDCTQVVVDVTSDPDAAGFVQVIQGQSKDPARAVELMSGDSDAWADFRPDVLASLSAAHADGHGYTMAVYFTSEADARAGEAKELPAELQADMDEMMTLTTGEPTYFDLREPWLFSKS